MDKTVRGLCQKILQAPIDISTLKLYASMQMLRNIMDTSGWKYPSAAFKFDLKLKPKIDELGNFLSPDFILSPSYRTDFSKIYDQFSVLDLADFLTEYTPELVTNIDETLVILCEMDPDMPAEIRSKYILDMRRVQVMRSHIPDAGRWEIYRILVKRKQNSAPELSRDFFENLYTAVNCYNLSYRNKVSVADKKAIDVMREFHLPDEYLIQFYAQVRGLIAESFIGRKQKAIKEISNPAHYIRRRIGLDPKLDPLELDKLLNDAAEQIVKVKKPTDFLRALKGTDDSSLEIGFVRPKFLQKVVAKDTTLIVNPAPDFIINWNQKLWGQTTFCMEYEIEAELLKHEFPSICFICFDDLFDKLSEPVTQETLNNSYSQILIFGRGLSEKTQQQLLTTSSILFPDGTISILTSSVFLDQPTSFQWGATYFMRGWSIGLLPNGVASSGPKRKIYIEEISDK